MSLDNYWQLPANVAVEFEPELQLAGLWLSAGGQRSFQGTVYDQFFPEELDVSLYDDMTNDEVRTVAEELRDVKWREEFAEKHHYPNTERVLNDLTRMFEAYGQAGASLYAWS